MVTNEWMLYGGTALAVVGLVGLFLPALPGAIFLLAGIVVVAWADQFTRIGPGMLALIGLLTLAAAVVDYAASALGAKTAGATRWGVLGALLGAIVGLPFGVPGIIIGPAVGAVAAEFIRERNLRQAARAGLGTVAGFLLGMVGKAVLGFTAAGLALLDYLR